MTRAAGAHRAVAALDAVISGKPSPSWPVTGSIDAHRPCRPPQSPAFRHFSAEPTGCPRGDSAIDGAVATTTEWRELAGLGGTSEALLRKHPAVLGLSWECNCVVYPAMPNQDRHTQPKLPGFRMDWAIVIPEQNWTSLPSGGAIGRDELGPCVLRTGPAGGSDNRSEDGLIRLEEIEAICKRTREEALELLASKLPAREGALALLASKISDNWDLQRRNSFVPFRFGLELPRASSEVERQVFGSNSFIVTGEPTNSYNCRGSALGCQRCLKELGGEGGEGFMSRMGCKELSKDKELPSDGIVLALYAGSRWDGCHVARRLVRDWYESQCGSYLRIVHRRLDIESVYGTFQGYWLLDAEARDRAMAQESSADGLTANPCSDSLASYGTRLLHMLDELDGGTNEILTSTS